MLWPGLHLQNLLAVIEPKHFKHAAAARCLGVVTAQPGCTLEHTAGNSWLLETKVLVC